jgi:hypothetical protein
MEERTGSGNIRQLSGWRRRKRHDGSRGADQANARRNRLHRVRIRYLYRPSSGGFGEPAGKFIKPDVATGANALADLKLPANLRGWLPDPPGEDAYPIVSYTWLVVRRKYADPRMAQVLKSVISFGLNEGQQNAGDLGYFPLPADVVKAVAIAMGQIS